EIAKSQPKVAAMLADAGPLRDFLVAALSLSPYLRDTAAISPQLVATAVCEPLDDAIERLICTARDCWRPKDGRTPGEAEVMTCLLNARRSLSFLVALADLARLFTARDTTRALSLMADAAVAAAIDHLLLAAHESGKVKLKDPDAPSAGSGLIVIGMGKLGG